MFGCLVKLWLCLIVAVQYDDYDYSSVQCAQDCSINILDKESYEEFLLHPDFITLT